MSERFMAYLEIISGSTLFVFAYPLFIKGRVILILVQSKSVTFCQSHCTHIPIAAHASAIPKPSGRVCNPTAPYSLEAHKKVCHRAKNKKNLYPSNRTHPTANLAWPKATVQTPNSSLLSAKLKAG